MRTMNCDDVLHHIDDHLDGTIDPAAESALSAHAAACPDCAERLRQEAELREALRELPVPPPRNDLLAGARARAQRRHRQRWFTGVTTVGLAASLLLALLLGPLQPFGPAAPGPEAVRTASVAVTPGRTERVQLVFNSPKAMQRVTLHLELPAGVELAGYPGQRRLEWQTSLEAGRNLLELPVVLRGTAGGALRAGIRYDGESRHFQLQLQPHAPQESGLGLNGRTA